MALVYSCCFWFSLRLGGILIAIFSVMQGVAVLVSCCVAHAQPQSIKDNIAALINSLNLIYIRPYLENVQQDPEKYLSFVIALTCIYILICLLYAYGAYALKNGLMFGYILVELLRLMFLTFVIITSLLMLKENTLNIGIHIGSSVAGSFFLLGMFYLWICAANLPILINEMERDEHAAAIYKLQQMLKVKNSPFTAGVQSIDVTPALERKNVFAISNFQRNNILKPTFQNYLQDSKFYHSHFYH